MPKRAKPTDASANIAICDIGRTSARMCRRDDPLDEARIDGLPTSDFTGPSPMLDLLSALFDRTKIPREGATLYLSVPASVAGDTAVFPQMPAPGGAEGEWRFSIKKLKDELGLGDIFPVNDVVALGMALPEVLRTDHYELIGPGIQRTNYPFVILAARSGVGGGGFVVDRTGGMIPIQGEGGHLGLTPSSDPEHQVLHHLRDIYRKQRRRDLLSITGHDVLSGPGSLALYEAVMRYREVEVEAPREARDISRMAKSGGPEGEIARLTIEMWCRFFGSLARNLTLAYGAFGGVYLAGPLANDFLSRGSGWEAFHQNFEIGGPSPGYLSSIPRVLITHPNPYLRGLARLGSVI
ncbi:glucokinase [Phenylobacterium sp.]|jgi:glucokinase|uniref:glucokinase n=1 Tax=Phenylobacterium sp. TaxID=1871053 RepID=UPI002F40E6DD